MNEPNSSIKYSIMEQINSFYTIEKHLEESSKANKKFEVLDAIWKLNKSNLSSALSTISQYYPHYSLHDQIHSNTIIDNIESFLGEERIRKLSPTNSWLILMSSFTHDLGMIVFQDLVEKEWLSEDFQNFLIELRDWDDIDMRESGENLLRMQEISKGLAIDDQEWLLNLTPLKIKNSVTLAVAEYIRRIHHNRSAEVISGVDKSFFEIAQSFYSDQIPSRLLNVLAEIAYLHGVDFYEIFNRLDFESNGISNDKINPRFISCLLRLGDLLDVDDKRFNVFTEQVFKYPKSSLLHKQKHSSVKHILITPEAIEITSDCPNEEVYRLSRSWFDWLEAEVEKQSKEWSNIAPTGLGGSSPTIPKGKIKVYFNSKIIDDKLLNLRFEVSNNKMFEILEGSSIYEKSEFTFIRELVQNAIDASKIQLWTDIEKGTFDFVFKKEFENKSLTHQEILNKIEFPTDIPELLYDSFEVKLVIKWKDKLQNSLVFSVQDNGTGISNPDLLRMTSKVGESRKKDKEHQKMLKRMPFWLKPTGAFGIGMQSVFIIVDSFLVQTKAEGEDSKQIIFRSSKKGKYSSIGKEQPIMERGTNVIVEVPKKRFPEVFGHNFDMGIVMHYDYFTDKHKSIHVQKIRVYINEILANIGTLNVDFFGKSLLIRKSEDQLFYQFNPVQSKDNTIQCRLLLRDNDLFFNFNEKIIGSEFIIQFFTDFGFDIKDHWPSYQNAYFVRDIPVKDSTIQYYKLSYSKLFWNFMSPDSDKILSLTREKFISKKKEELSDEFISRIIPTAIELMENTFLENKREVLKYFGKSIDSLSYGYFKLLLTKKVNNIKGQEMDMQILHSTTLPIELAQRSNDKLIMLKDFFSIKKIIIPVSNKTPAHSSTIRDTKKELIKKAFGTIKNEDVIFWNENFFRHYLLSKYSIQEIYFFESGKVLVLTTSKESIRIKSGKNIYLNQLLKSSGISQRAWYYSNQKYEKQLSIKNIRASGFEYFPFLSKRSIISPFKNHEEYLKVKTNLKGLKEINDIKKFLTNKYLSEFITDSLIEWIIKYNPDNAIKRDVDSILEAYRLLIIELVTNDI